MKISKFSKKIKVRLLVISGRAASEVVPRTV